MKYNSYIHMLFPLIYVYHQILEKSNYYFQWLIFVEFDKNHFPRHFSSHFKIKNFFFFSTRLLISVCFLSWSFFSRWIAKYILLCVTKAVTGLDYARIRPPLRQAFQFVANLNVLQPDCKALHRFALDQHFRCLRTDVFELVCLIGFKPSLFPHRYFIPPFV